MYDLIIKAIFCLVVLWATPVEAIADFDIQARIGGPSTYELGIFQGSSPIPSQQGQHSWTSGQAVSWQLSYAAATHNLTFIWGVGSGAPQTLTVTTADSLTGGLKIWAKSSGAVQAGERVDVANLVLTYSGGTLAGSAIGASGPGSGAGDYMEYQFLPNLIGDWTLTGDTMLTWTGGAPLNSELEFNIQSAPVPEPASWLLLGTMIAVAIVLSKRKTRPI